MNILLPVTHCVEDESNIEARIENTSNVDEFLFCHDFGLICSSRTICHMCGLEAEVIGNAHV